MPITAVCRLQQKKVAAMTRPTPVILDISEWQEPAKIDYTRLAAQIDHVIVRVQYGSSKCDRHYQTHLQHFQKNRIPTAVYAWVRGTSISDMEQEARCFFDRAKAFAPTFYWLDVEEFSMPDMHGGVEAYRKTLKRLTGEQVGLYAANHLYQKLNLNAAAFDGLWLPTYGKNNGRYEGYDPTAASDYDLHQYTSAAKLAGYHGFLDLSRLAGRRPFSYFTKSTAAPDTQWGNSEAGTFTLTSAVYLRQAPAVTSPSITLLPKGTKIRYDRFKHENGYVWIRQPRASGAYGYLATGLSDGTRRTGPAWGYFS